jgi:hypothetical protein
MGVERFWYAREPGQRTWVDRRQRWEAPLDDGGHVAGTAEVSSGGGCLQVAERVFTGLRREGEQLGSQSRPGRFSGESGEVVVNLVELCDGLPAEELVGFHRPKTPPIRQGSDQVRRPGARWGRA